MRKTAHTLTIIAACALTLCSCGDLLEAHPYDAKPSGEIHINSKNISLIEERLAGRDSIRFAFISDTQRWYDETEDVVRDLNRRGDVDFVVHGGDFTDFGVTEEFTWQRDILGKLDVPYVGVIGNHDCLGNGEYTFRKVFGDYDFAFTAGNVRFICLNTNALEFDYSQDIPDFTFMTDELRDFPEEATKTVFLMHARPGSDVFNNNVFEPFGHYVRMFPDVQFCMNGHNHSLEAADLYGDGIIYYQCPNIEKRTYYIFTICDGGYRYETVSF